PWPHARLLPKFPMPKKSPAASAHPPFSPVRRWAAIGAVMVAAGIGVSFFLPRKLLPTAAASTSLRALPKGFEATKANSAKPPGPAPEGMVWIPGGEFSMGSDDPTTSLCGGKDAMPDARPIHRVYVDGFWMDRSEVP